MKKLFSLTAILILFITADLFAQFEKGDIFLSGAVNHSVSKRDILATININGDTEKLEFRTINTDIFPNLSYFISNDLAITGGFGYRRFKREDFQFVPQINDFVDFETVTNTLFLNFGIKKYLNITDNLLFNYGIRNSFGVGRETPTLAGSELSETNILSNNLRLTHGLYYEINRSIAFIISTSSLFFDIERQKLEGSDTKTIDYSYGISLRTGSSSLGVSFKL